VHAVVLSQSRLGTARPRIPIGGNLLSKSSVDTTLSGNGVRSGREKLRNTGSVETSFSQTEGSAQTGTTGTDDDGIILVVLQPSELHPFVLDPCESVGLQSRGTCHRCSYWTPWRAEVRWSRSWLIAIR